MDNSGKNPTTNAPQDPTHKYPHIFRKIGLSRAKGRGGVRPPVGRGSGSRPSGFANTGRGGQIAPRGGMMKNRPGLILTDEAVSKRQNVDVPPENGLTLDNPEASPTPPPENVASGEVDGKSYGPSSSSLRNRINNLSKEPSLLSDLQSEGGFPIREGDFMEDQVVGLPDWMISKFRALSVTTNKLFRQELDVFEDEALLLDRPSHDGTLGYQLLQSIRLPFDSPDQTITVPAATHCHNLAAVALSGLELVDLYRHYQRAYNELKKHHEDISHQFQLQTTELEKQQLEYSSMDKEARTLQKQVEELRPAGEAAKKEKARADQLEKQLKTAKQELADAAEKGKQRFLGSDEFVQMLNERYNGGWGAARRCVVKDNDKFDWSRMEEAYKRGDHLTPIEDESPEASEEDICNVDPRLVNLEAEEEADK